MLQGKITHQDQDASGGSVGAAVKGGQAITGAGADFSPCRLEGDRTDGWQCGAIQTVG